MIPTFPALVLCVTIAGIVSDELAEVPVGPAMAFMGRAGDFDGDGLTDVLTWRTTPAVEIDLRRGIVGGIAEAPSSTLHPSLAPSGGLEAEVGDFDDDGFADLAVVVHDAEGAPQIAVYHGGPAGLADPPTQLLVAPPGPLEFGGALVVADVDGDGDDDLVVGYLEVADMIPDETGALWVFAGGADGLADAPLAELYGEPFEQLGLRVEWAGDVDGDGREDVLVRSNGEGMLDNLAVHAGADDGLAPTPLWTITAAGFDQGTSFFGAGDVDGDGFGEVAAYLTWEELSIYRGSADGPALDPSWSFTGDELEVVAFGRWSGALGDLDGDGADEFAVGAGGGPDLATADGVAMIFVGNPGAAPALGWIHRRGQQNPDYGAPVLAIDSLGDDELGDIAVLDAHFDHEIGMPQDGALVLHAGQPFVCDDEVDADGDSVCNDNCPTVPNPFQDDLDGDGIGDACEVGGTETGSEGSSDATTASTSESTSDGGGETTTATGDGGTTDATTTTGGPASTDTRDVGGCGCTSGREDGTLALVGLALALVRRRRRASVVLALIGPACNPATDLGEFTATTGSSSSGSTPLDTGSTGTGTSSDAPPLDVGGLCCSADGTAVEHCGGAVQSTCAEHERCDPGSLTCMDLCARAREESTSVGCEFRLAFLDGSTERSPCFVALVTNVSSGVAHLETSWAGAPLEVGASAFRAAGVTALGEGQYALETEPVDLAAGLLPGEQVALALSGTCPVDVLVEQDEAQLVRSSIGASFGIASDSPISVHQVHDFGGAAGYVASSTLLFPTHTWAETYVLMAPVEDALEPSTDDDGAYWPSAAIVALEGPTQIELAVTGDVAGGAEVPSASAGETLVVTLAAGEVLQLVEPSSLAGTIVGADKPIAAFAGHECAFYPYPYGACDHLEQMLPPAAAAGSVYPAVAPRRAPGEPGVFVVTALVDETAIAFTPEVAEPRVLGRGEQYVVAAPEAFAVSSQDDAHPFLFATLVSGADYLMSPPYGVLGIADLPLGDPDYVLSIPPGQFDREYTAFVDPTYAFAQLVLVRHAVDIGGETPAVAYGDVTLDCLGTIDGWQDLGAQMQYRRIDMVADFADVGACGAGVHRLEGNGPFAVWVWNWAQYTSVGSAISMGTRRLNDVFDPAG